MIALHRITQPDHELYVSPDLIQLIEANPDTVITLTNGSKYVVAEPPGEVARLVAEWRASVIAAALTAPVVVNHPRVGEAVGQILQFPARPQ
jgi:flagellar protein FlbD